MKLHHLALRHDRSLFWGSLAILAFLVLGGCQGTAEVRATTSLAVACDSMATALQELAPLRAAGKLSAKTEATVEQVNQMARPFCLPDSPFDPETAIGTVRSAVDLLSTAKAQP